MEIRRERPDDKQAVRAVNEMAFGQQQEADIVDALRDACQDLVSLVAVIGDRVAGHILFSPAVLEDPAGAIHGMVLAPMAVLPEFQRRDVGSSLVGAGLDILRAAVCPFVIVLGHAGYYPRFGFERASKRGIASQWEGVPDEAFMVLILNEQEMDGKSGAARYRTEFDATG